MISLDPRPNTKEQQNGHNSAFQQDANARAYILALKAHEKPDTMPDVGKWWQCCNIIKASLEHNPTHIEIVIKDLYGSYPGLKELLADDWGKDPLQGKEGYPELPAHVKANEARADEASPILDALIAFFKHWCTRSYDGYHEAVAIWVLTTIAARRVILRWRGGMWTNFYIMLVSKSGRHAKTEAASYGTKVIRDCGLGFLLAPDETSPQRLLSKMSGKTIPRNYSLMNEDEKKWLCHKLAFSAQKGWQYDEFGDFLQEVIKSRGYNALFYRLIKQLYDNKPEFTYDTGTRGEENIQLPSLSIIGTTAPESLAPIAGANSSVWTDGAFARIAFIVPPPDSIKLQSAPEGEAVVPDHIKQKLLDWHYQLGIPACTIIDLEEQEDLLEEAQGKDGKKKRHPSEPYKIDRDNLPQQDIYWNGSGVREAHELYYRTLVEIGAEYNLDARLNSNYVRLPDMALKIAMLLASLENNGHMDMRHWARGQQITERWRQDLHQLMTQIAGEGNGGFGEIEDKVLEVITTKLNGKKASSYDIARAGSTLLRKTGSTEVRKICDELHTQGLIDKEGSGRGALYGVKEVRE
jgi:hypothetical protein